MWILSWARLPKFERQNHLLQQHQNINHSTENESDENESAKNMSAKNSFTRLIIVGLLLENIKCPYYRDCHVTVL